MGVVSTIPLVDTGGIFDFDFTAPSGQANGTGAQNEVGVSTWGMISGDVNSDGQTTLDDKSLNWDNDAGMSGFHKTDVNLNGQVDNKDKVENWLPNMGKGSLVPEYDKIL